MNDKFTERDRYQKKSELALGNYIKPRYFGAESIELPLRAPYTYFEKVLKEHIYPETNFYILEVGAGDGIHTKFLVNSGATVVATDISATSLDLLLKNLDYPKNIQTKVADIEELPFLDGEFDLVVSAGVMSYGDNEKFMHEIYRVLKQGGIFICIDSLNENPIFRLNRYLNYLRGNRSWSTIVNMPSLKTISNYEKFFKTTKIEYFGSISYLSPLLKIFLSVSKIAQISDKVDRFFLIKKSAFKFVMVAVK